MEKLKMHSPDLIQDNIAKIRDLFPGCVTEAKDENGNLRYAVDFDQLRQELSDQIVEGPQERYRLDWPGKRAALLAANAPIAKTLRPARTESVEFDTTRNLFIEGDNLDALKLLQETYLRQIKLIYIDPPYNTGKDFVYRDSFAVDIYSNEVAQGERSEDGLPLVANPEGSGRFHSNWLSMMYPRLMLARNLLKDDGVLLISIDDSEVQNLRRLCDEVLGEQNFIASVIWEKGRKNDAKFISVGHEYVLVYARNKEYLKQKGAIWRELKPGADSILAEFKRLKGAYGTDYPLIEAGLREYYQSLPKGHPAKKHARYNKVDKFGVWRDDNMSWPGGGGPDYEVLHPKTGLPCAVPEGGWRYSTPEKMKEMIEQGKVVFRDDHSEPPIRKTYLLEVSSDEELDNDEPLEESDGDDLPIQVAGSYFYRSGLQASNDLTGLFGAKVFNNPKDREVLARWISYVGTSDGDIVLDFFAGSGTTAHAVLDINHSQKKTLRYIVVQLPEPIDPKSKGAKPAVKFLDTLKRPRLVSELTKERLRRAGTALPASDLDTEIDTGFRVLKIDSSNMADVHYTPLDVKQGELLSSVENIKPGRDNPEDLLFQVLVDWGLDLTLPIRKEAIQGKTVFFVSDEPYDLIACFDKGISEELVKELARHAPMRMVFRDNGFTSDAMKINAEQILKQLSPDTEVKAI